MTVVIPTRNRTMFLARSLTCALAQRGVNLEVVVVDDGSTVPVTESPALAEMLRDPRVRVVRNDRSAGVAAARNRGIAAASAVWIAFLDDDDLWLSTKLAAQLAVLSRSHVPGWSYTGEVVLNDRLEADGVPPAPDPQTLGRLLPKRNAVPGGGSSVVAHADLLEKAGGFDPDFSILADWDLWLRLSALIPPVAVPKSLTGYIRHAGGMSANTGQAQCELQQLILKYRGDPAVQIDRTKPSLSTCRIWNCATVRRSEARCF